MALIFNCIRNKNISPFIILKCPLMYTGYNKIFKLRKQNWK